MKEYDWIIVGGGIAGISLAEILSRREEKVAVLEKNDMLASEMSGQFHEWFHSGALYTLGTLSTKTLSYILGSTDDILSYYSDFPRMNIVGSEQGLAFNGRGWFNPDYIHYQFRNRPWNPIWSANVAMTTAVIKEIAGHDFLRRRAGSIFASRKIGALVKPGLLINNSFSDKFIDVESPDFSINSRELICDLVDQAASREVEFLLNFEIDKLVNLGGKHKVVSSTGDAAIGRRVVICAPGAAENLFEAQVTKHYAPMVVLEDCDPELQNFVRLDYYTKNCVNYIRKPNGMGLAGGISFKNYRDADEYRKFICKEHLSLQPNAKVVGEYMGIKNEQVTRGKDRNYLFHIQQYDEDIFSIVLGKFTSAFSLAPEFYRQYFRENPPKPSFDLSKKTVSQDLVAPREWQKIGELKNGND